MHIRWINLLLLTLLVLLVGTIFIVRRNYPTRNVELLPGMVSYVAYNAQSVNPNFADGKTLQRPVAGTVVRGFPPLPSADTTAVAMSVGEKLTNPLNVNDSIAAVERGATVFANICKPCHGARGAGDGIIPQKGYPPPPSLLAENALKLRDEQIFNIITNGQRNMPSFATQVVRQDRWRVIRYIRSLQQQSLQKNIAAQ
ncbi:MAG: cytochrome c [Ignavibacteriae bacterium]|nr:cytochrome c [Ignavibacteriota bacterium]